MGEHRVASSIQHGDEGALASARRRTVEDENPVGHEAPAPRGDELGHSIRTEAELRCLLPRDQTELRCGETSVYCRMADPSGRN